MSVISEGTQVIQAEYCELMLASKLIHLCPAYMYVGFRWVIYVRGRLDRLTTTSLIL